MDEQPLTGGVANAGAVVRRGDVVLRPANPATTALQALLRHVRSAGFDGVPEPLGLDGDGRERLRFIPGDVPEPPYPAWAQRDEALASAAALLRRFHDAQVGFVATAGTPWSPEMADPVPGPDPVIAHNDLCLENLVFRDERAIAILDLDFAAPGRRAWDLASLARMGIPTDRADAAARLGWGPMDVAGRLRLIADAYGLDRRGRADLLDALSTQIARAGRMVVARAAAGEPAFVGLLAQLGGEERFIARRTWFATEHDRFAEVLQ